MLQTFKVAVALGSALSDTFMVAADTFVVVGDGDLDGVLDRGYLLTHIMAIRIIPTMIALLLL
jgi:hypothetical protein